MNTTKFQEAQDYFSQLEGFIVRGNRELCPVGSLDEDRHFATAAHAVAVLYSLSKEALGDLERSEIVHPSTVSGGSLGTAMKAVNDYLLGKEEVSMSRDDCEQLARTCHSAKRFLDLVKGNYTPAF